MQKLLSIFATILIVIGFIGFFFGFLCGIGVANDLGIEYPLGHPQGIVVDNTGKIYCCLQFYQRIQVYDNKGNFIKGWPIDSSGGHFDIDLSPDNKLHIDIARRDEIQIYTTDGQLLKKIKSAGKNHHNSRLYKDHLGNKYEIRSPMLMPHIVKITPLQKETTIISMSFYKWVITGPLICWLLIPLGIILLAIIQKFSQQSFSSFYARHRPKLFTIYNNKFMLPACMHMLLTPIAFVLGFILGAVLFINLSQPLKPLLNGFSIILLIGTCMIGSIVGVALFFHSLFTAYCCDPNCSGEAAMINNDPVTYRCSKCGNMEKFNAYVIG